MSNNSDILARLDRKKLGKICRRHNILALYLFGSHASGLADRISDVDLGVVFPRGTNLSNTMKLYSDLFLDFSGIFGTEDLDIVFLQKAGPILADNAIRGKLLYSSDDEARMEFEDYVLMRALDFRPWVEQYDREMLAAIREEVSIGK